MSDCGTVLVADSDPTFRGLAADLVARAGLAAVVAGTGDDALERVAAGEPPALALVEVELPGRGGFDVLYELHDRFGADLPVILVSSVRAEAFDRAAGLLAGADDYVVKPSDPGELTARMRRSLRRASVGVNGTHGTSRRVNGGPALSPREREILEYLARGRTQQEIASELVISPKTVATHIQHLLSKLGVHSRAQAVARAFQLGLV